MANSKDQKKEGIEIALEIVESIKDMASGIYIIPPFDRYDIAIEIIRFCHIL